jgi:hypothetical protein
VPDLPSPRPKYSDNQKALKHSAIAHAIASGTIPKVISHIEETGYSHGNNPCASETAIEFKVLKPSLPYGY